MTYYPDLSRYEYFPSLLPLRNVGWLASGQDFPTGEVSAEVMDALVALAREPDAVSRGFHACEFCPRDASDDTRDAHFTIRGTRLLLGHAEVRVRDAAGTWYAAPTLVLHYIDAHRYLPPAGFLAALIDRPSQAVLDLKQVDQLVSSFVEDKELRSLFQWLQDPDADATWVSPGESELRASRHEGRVLLTFDDDEQDELDPDDMAECDQHSLIGLLGAAFAARP